jgi:hypothetical protein
MESWLAKEMFAKCLRKLGLERSQPQLAERLREFGLAGIQPARFGPGATNRFLGRAHSRQNRCAKVCSVLTEAWYPFAVHPTHRVTKAKIPPVSASFEANRAG